MFQGIEVPKVRRTVDKPVKAREEGWSWGLTLQNKDDASKIRERNSVGI